MRHRTGVVLSFTAAFALLAAGAASAAKTKKPAKASGTSPSAASCALLDNPKAAGLMDGLLFSLAKRCNRPEFLGGVESESVGDVPSFEPSAIDIAVSNPNTDTPHQVPARTQSETSIALNETTGTLCAAWNDAYHGVSQNIGFSGFGRSTDGGATWTDSGPVSPAFANRDVGDPSLVWRKADEKFYYAALHDDSGGLAVFRSDNDCQSFTFVSLIATLDDDKEIMTVDNNPASPFYGRLYVAWTDFGQGARIYSTKSTDLGVTWSAQTALSTVGEDVQGAWPAVAPNGDLYVSWVHWISPGFPSGNIDAQISRSTDGGATFAALSPPMANKVNPRDSGATGSCGRPALGGNIRYLPNPTIALDSTGNLHAVYSYDPDTFNSGDESNVYYRKSTDGGATWLTEIQVNDDGGTTDQWQPSLSIGAGNVVTVGYYSRQNDAGGNLLFDYYSRSSNDGGATFQASTRLTDASSSVVLDEDLATCYHGDYDTQITGNGFAHLLWSDDRDPAGAPLATPNIYTEKVPVTDYYPVVQDPTSRSICAGGTAVYPVSVLQFQGFLEEVTFSATGNPGSTSASFLPNPVTPPGSSDLTIGNTGGEVFGTYQINVNGLSSPGNVARSVPVWLTIYPEEPTAVTLVSPADGATDVSTSVALSWTGVPLAMSYLVEVDDDPGFGSLAYSATVTGTSVSASGLLADTGFYWRVRASNPCGDSVVSEARTFHTAFEYCSSPNLAIFDNSTAFTTIVIPPGALNVSDLNVGIQATHTYVGDVSFTLTHGTDTAIFFNRPGVPASTFGCPGDDIDVIANDEGVDGNIETQCGDLPAIFGDRVGGDPASTTMLANFDGVSMSGTWTLTVQDWFGGDEGTLETWCLYPALGTMPFFDGFESGTPSVWVVGP